MTNDDLTSLETGIAQFRATLRAVGDTANMQAATEELLVLQEALVAEVRRLNAENAELRMRVEHSQHIDGLKPEEVKAFWWFVDLMKTKLTMNAYKGGWQSNSLHSLVSRVYEELQELEDSLDLVTTPRKAADVANMVMMVADVWCQAKEESTK